MPSPPCAWPRRAILGSSLGALTPPGGWPTSASPPFEQSADDGQPSIFWHALGRHSWPLGAFGPVLSHAYGRASRIILQDPLTRFLACPMLALGMAIRPGRAARTINFIVTLDEEQWLVAQAGTTGTVADTIRRLLRESGQPPASLFQSRGVMRETWPTFDDDVRRWVAGEAIDTFLRTGRSRHSLLVRFRNRAFELGLRQERASHRFSQVKIRVATYLSEAALTTREREIAACILQSNTLQDAATTLGLSRQRIQQIVSAAYQWGKSMAERLEKFPRARRGAIDPTSWADGSVWKLRRGEDFTQTVPSFQNSLRRIRNGSTRWQTQRDLADPNVLYVRCVTIVPRHNHTKESQS